MQLIQAQTPEIILKLKDYWRKYTKKLKEGLEEGELNRLMMAFTPLNVNRLLILVDNKKEIHGFALVFMDNVYNDLFVAQCSTDSPKEMKKALIEFAKKSGATGIYFNTERSPRAWERLLCTEKIGYTMKINLGG